MFWHTTDMALCKLQWSQQEIQIYLVNWKPCFCVNVCDSKTLKFLNKRILTFIRSLVLMAFLLKDGYSPPLEVDNQAELLAPHLTLPPPQQLSPLSSSCRFPSLHPPHLVPGVSPASSRHSTHGWTGPRNTIHTATTTTTGRININNNNNCQLDDNLYELLIF